MQIVDADTMIDSGDLISLFLVFFLLFERGSGIGCWFG